MVLPEGTTVPPLTYTLAILVATGGVAYGLYRTGARLSERMLLALSPWMVGGASLYVCYQLGVLPAAVAPFCSSPAVYLSTFAIAGGVWLGTQHTDHTVSIVAAVGVLFSLVPIAIALDYGASNGTLAPVWPAVGLVLAVVIALGTWVAFDRLEPDVADILGFGGLLAVFGHALDGVSTAVGVDVLGFAERTPLSRLVMDVAGIFPTASVFGVGWLFVLVKLLVSVAAIWLLAEYVREEPAQGYLLLLVIVAVGLGPGAHNLLLFTVLGSAGV